MKRSVLLVVVVAALVGCTAPIGNPDGGGSGGGSGGSGGGVGGGVGGGSGGTGGTGGSGGSGGGGGSGGSGGSGGAGGGFVGSTWDGGTPAWRANALKWQWIEIPGSSLSQLPVNDPINGGQVTPSGRIDAWNGLAADRDSNRLYLAAAGGHADWAGNEVYDLDLSADAPRWRMLRGPTPGANIVTNQPYYTDGRPSSTHLYFALHYVRSRARIFKLSAGSVWGDGNGNNNNVDAFSLASGDWDAAATFAGHPGGGGAIDRPYAQNITNDDLYTFSGGAFRRWVAATASWDQLAQRPSYANNDIVDRSGSAVDHTRQQVLYLANLYKTSPAQGLLLTFGGALTDVTFTGAGVSATRQSAPGFLFLPSEDAFLLKSSTGADLFRVHPTTFDVSAQATTGGAPPNAVNGIYTRFLFLPNLGGVAYLPSHASNVWFLVTQ